ncbi:hypothetical protein PFISCL1PPCAC_22256, partial [Pristionchus fissidentatus]
MIRDVTDLLDGFAELRKKAVLVNRRKAIFDNSHAFLTNNLTSILNGETTGYDGSQLIQDLVHLALQELDRSNKGPFKRDAFDLAVKFIPKAILADSIEAEDVIVIQWYNKIGSSSFDDVFIEPVLPCLQAYFQTVTPTDIRGDHVVETWKDLWSRVNKLHSMDHYSTYLSNLINCLLAMFKIAKQTQLADSPWNTVTAVIDGLGLRKGESRMWLRNRPMSVCEVLVFMRILLHEWGFTYRVQLIESMESMIKSIATAVEYTEKMAQWSEPWSEIKETSSAQEHAWLLLEEYSALAAPKACPIHVPSSVTPTDFVICELVDHLVVKYAKCSTSSDCPPLSAAACRLAARAMVVQHRLRKNGSIDDEGAAAAGAAGCSTQLASFTKMKVASQYGTQFASQFSSQMGTQQSSQWSTQRIVNRRKRKKEVKMLQTMAALDFFTLLDYCTPHARSNSIPIEWMRYVVECLTQVFRNHMEDLGSDAADLIQMTIASTKEIRREELIPAVARLLTTIMEKREVVDKEESCSESSAPSTSRRPSKGGGPNSDGAVISELWSRAHSWTHMTTCFDEATRLLVECDRWLLAHEEVSMLSPELRWSKLIEVLKPAPLSSAVAVDLLEHLIASYEFDENGRLEEHEEKHKGKDWPFRRELVDWLLMRSSSLQIASAIVCLCSYFPRRVKKKEVDRSSNPWVNQECRMQKLVRTQFDEPPREEEKDTRPDTLIAEMVEEVVEAMGRDSLDDMSALRRLCVLQRLTTRVKRGRRTEEPASSSDVLSESILSVRREMEVDGMEALAESRWESCQWLESYGVNAIDATTLLRHLQHEDIVDELPDMVFSSLVHRIEHEGNERDRRALTALCAVMKQFMMDHPEPEKLVSAIESIKSCTDLTLVDHTMNRLGDALEKLAEAAESVMDVQTMIYTYGHMVQPATRARLIDKMTRLVDDEKEEEDEGMTFAHNMELMIIAHYAMEIPLEYAMLEMDRSDVVERVLTQDSLVSRLQLESDNRGEMTGECEELVKACLSPGRWEDHSDTVRIVARWPLFFKRCLSSLPLLGAIMDEMAAAIDIDTVIKKEIKEEDEMEDDDNCGGHKDYIDLENIWSPMHREISRITASLRLKEERIDQQFSCSMDDSSLPTALLLPRSEWKILFREWNGTQQSHAVKILVEYGKRCTDFGLELRFLQMIEHLMAQSCMENSPYRLMLEALAEEALWSIHSRCSGRSTDFIRADAQWKRIRNRIRPTFSPSHFRLLPILKEQQPRTFGDADFDPENLSSLICTSDWWSHTARVWEETAAEAAVNGDWTKLADLRCELISAYRLLHEARCVPHSAATVLPQIAERGGEMTRSNFDADSFTGWLGLHIELWCYGKRFKDASPEEIDVIMSVYEQQPVGNRRSGEEEGWRRCEDEHEVITRLLQLASNAATSAEWKTLLSRMTTVLPAMNLHFECLPFIVALSPAEEAIETILLASTDLLHMKDEEERSESRRKRKRDGEGEKRVGDVAVLIEESLNVVGISILSKVCEDNGRDAEQPLLDLAKLSIDSGVMNLARICTDLAAESSLPNRPLFLFDPTFPLPDCLEETRKAAVIATRDAVTARSLRSSTQAQDEIRRILAESRYDWHLSTSKEARSALDESTEEYLLRFTVWSSFSKKLGRNEDSLNGSIVLMEKDKEGCGRVVKRLRNIISSRLSSTHNLLSKEVENDVKCSRLLNIFEEKDESPLPLPLLSDSAPSISSHWDEDCLLRVNVALARWKRREEGQQRISEIPKTSLRDRTHEKVERAVKHLESIKAYKPALRLLSQWSNVAECTRVKGMVKLDEARIRVQMGEDYVALHEIGEMRRETDGEGKGEMLARAAFLEAEIALEETRNREKSRRIVKEALFLLPPFAQCARNSREYELLHGAHRRLFEQTAKILEETQTIIESRGFMMKREAIEKWTKQLEEIKDRRLEADRKMQVRLEREIACEMEEIGRMESRMAQLATECIVAGLDALKTSPNTKSETSAEILFPLLDVLFKYGQTPEVGVIVKDHITSSSCEYFVQGIGHIVGHVFNDTPITKPLRLLLVKLVMIYPFHTVPRLLFYDEEGGHEEANIKDIIEFAVKKRPEVKEKVEKMRRVQRMFREFTAGDMNDRTMFTRGLVNGKECYRMNAQKVSLYRDQQELRHVPIPTVHLEASQSIESVPHIVSVCDIFDRADGLSAPKVLTVRTSDGEERRIICKKEDVRQDTMVEHLFEVINSILKKMNGGRIHQEMRTYKVVPLDINNGLIEFCGGTISLKQLLCGMDRESGLHREIHPDDISGKEACIMMGNACQAEKVEVFKKVCERLRPVFRHYFYKAYGSPREWSERLNSYRRSLATWSIVCYVVGLGDRHASNVLFEPSTAKFVHIDLGMILEYSKRSLPVPERVPFRLTRDLVDPLIGDALDGHFTQIAVDTMVSLRKKSSVLLGIASAILRETMTNFEEATPSKESSLISKAAIGRLRDKLAGTD